MSVPGDGDQQESPLPEALPPRVFLCVVDHTVEMAVAIRYACRRAHATGGHVALLAVVRPPEFQHWGAVETLMLEEQRAEAEVLLQEVAGNVAALSGSLATLHIRQGELVEQVLELIQEDLSISVLVLAAGVGPKGPGPLVTHLTTRGLARLRVPLTIIPGGLSDDQIERAR